MVAVWIEPGYIMGLKIDGTVVMAGSVVANTDPDKVDENMRALEEIAS